MSDWCAWIEDKSKKVLKVIDKPDISLREAEQILRYAFKMLETKRNKEGKY